MEDESGLDAKILAVPVRALTSLYDDVQSYEDMPKLVLHQVVCLAWLIYLFFSSFFN